MDQIKKSVLRNAKLSDLPTILASYKGTPIPGIPLSCLPKQVKMVTNGQGQQFLRQLQFQDFKEAFRYFNLLTGTLSSVKYYPTVFNVYNRLEFYLATTDNDRKIVTTKDLFIAHLLNETLASPTTGLQQAAENFNRL